MPFWSAEIQTAMPPDEVERTLRGLLRPPSVGLWDSVKTAFVRPSDLLPFNGEVWQRSFKIHRAIGYRNSFLPIVRGEIDYRTDGGSIVRLRMTLPLFTTAFMLFWFSGLTWIVMTSADFSPLMGILFGVLLVLVGFYPEARKAERIVRDALKT